VETVSTETLLALALGIGLAAASGFRTFVPLLVVSLAARHSYLTLAPGMEWLATDTALAALALATVLEIAAYYTPWLDNLLDTIATPAAILAGTLLMVAVLPDLPPLLRWSLAIIAGGGAAGLIQALTVLLRLQSATLTGGLANPLVATLELIGALAVSLLSLLTPILALILVVAVGVFGLRRVLARRRHASRPPVR
jgi:hypothetical protein